MCSSQIQDRLKEKKKRKRERGGEKESWKKREIGFFHSVR